MKLRMFAGLALAALLFIPLSAGAQTLWGSEYNGNSLYQINPSSGAASTTCGFSTRMPGLAWNPNSGTMYGIDENNLYIVNVNTCGQTLVGATGVPVTGLTFNTSYTTLYTIGYNGNFYSINPATGTATLIGALGVSPNTIVDLATRSDGTVFAAGTANNLYTINVATGAATNLGALSGTTNSDGLTSMVFDNNDTLFAIDTDSDRLVTVDTVTRVLTFVSVSGIGGDLRGLAFVPAAAPVAPAVPALDGRSLALLIAVLAGAAVVVLRR